MATLGDFARQHTDLGKEAVGHLQNLVSEWGMLADFCFADLLLYLPTTADDWLLAAHVRAATGQTLYIADFVGSTADDERRRIIESSFDSGDIEEGEISIDGVDAAARMLAIPVRHGDRPIAVLTREWSTRSGRQPGELERTYLEIFGRFAGMIRSGLFPFPGRVADSSISPRVGDGVLVIDDDAKVRYASPNAVSALHRVGIGSNSVGQTLSELGFTDSAVRQAFERGEPVVEEFDQTAEVTLLARCMPLIEVGAERTVTGAVLLLRDVSELRRRDRLILSKDATIREIHHRVKNNLQTISSLLRLQVRRLDSPEAKAAVDESVRRIRTIALVHETLSREPGDDVTFIEIVRPLLRLVEDSLQSPDRPVSFVVHGDGGRVPATVATPLSVVLTELLQNAVDHGFREGLTGKGSVAVQLSHETDADDHVVLCVRVIDNGAGLATDFDIANATGLGLSIVRTLVTTELGGTIAMRRATPDDHVVDDATRGASDNGAGPGTVIELRVPLRPV
jgi:two-component system, sensor histidine kinase PdtaS